MSGGGRVLVTGAGGFVGRAVVADLAAAGRPVRAQLRRPAPLPEAAEAVRIEEIATADWRPALRGVDAVIHLAARVHAAGAEAADEPAFMAANRDATARLAAAAAESGVRRLVFASSVKAMGESSPPGGALDEAAPCRPADPYGRSKRAAELRLAEIAAGSRLEIVVLRPPLVYGPGVGANFRRLLRAVDRGLPLPFGLVRNRRSLVHRGNLASALIAALDHPAAAGATFLVADGPPWSTPELIRLIAAALGRPARLLPVPPALLAAAGRLAGRGAAVERLLGDLAVDDRRLRTRLGWAPPVAPAAGLAATAGWWRAGGDPRA
jgi:nucleoside-diphosphate-sugar epimerase